MVLLHMGCGTLRGLVTHDMLHHARFSAYGMLHQAWFGNTQNVAPYFASHMECYIMIGFATQGVLHHARFGNTQNVAPYFV